MDYFSGTVNKVLLIRYELFYLIKLMLQPFPYLCKRGRKNDKNISKQLISSITYLHYVNEFISRCCSGGSRILNKLAQMLLLVFVGTYFHHCSSIHDSNNV